MKRDFEVITTALQHPRFRSGGLSGWKRDFFNGVFDRMPIHQKLDPEMLTLFGITKSPADLAAAEINNDNNNGDNSNNDNNNGDNNDNNGDNSNNNDNNGDNSNNDDDNGDNNDIDNNNGDDSNIDNNNGGNKATSQQAIKATRQQH